MGGSRCRRGAAAPEGTRFLDVTDPTNIVQVGYFRPNGANTWAPYWRGDLVYVADNSRGVDIVRPLVQAGVTARVAEPEGSAKALEPVYDPLAEQNELDALRLLCNI